jgi:hypothetical protein
MTKRKGTERQRKDKQRFSLGCVVRTKLQAQNRLDNETDTPVDMN